MSHIRHIREKIEDDPAHPVYIQTVWGVGYKFNGRAGSECISLPFFKFPVL